MWDGFQEFLLLVALEAGWHNAFAAAMKVGAKIDRAGFLVQPMLVVIPLLDYARYHAAGGREIGAAKMLLPGRPLPRGVAEQMMARRN